MPKDTKREPTKREAKFVEALPNAKNFKEAAIEAGYSENSARQRAYEVKQREHVKDMIDDRYASLQKAADVTLDSLIQELQEARELASQQKNPNALTATIMAKAKLTGFDINRNLDLTAKSDTEVLEALYDGGTLQELIALHHSKTGKYLVESDKPSLATVELRKEA